MNNQITDSRVRTASRDICDTLRAQNAQLAMTNRQLAVRVKRDHTRLMRAMNANRQLIQVINAMRNGDTL